MHIEIKPGEKPIEVLIKRELLERIEQRASLRGEIELDPKGGREARLTSPGVLHAQGGAQ